MSGVILYRQRGATLLVAMVFMVVLMLVVVSAIQVGNVNTRVAGNRQTQQEAEAAAQWAIEEVISQDLLKLPAAKKIEVNINDSGQGKATYQVTVVPTCLAVSPIQSTDLQVSSEDDHSCFASGAAQNAGIVSAIATPAGLSLCSEAVWNVEATVTSAQSDQPISTLTQGVSQRVDPGTNC